MKEIGGYFEFEEASEKSFHPNALELNTARNCFEYLLRAKNIKTIYIPYFTCAVMLEPLEKLSIDYMYYHVDQNLEPINISDTNLPILYTNYFGIKSGCIAALVQRFPNSIIDNSMAFFNKPLENIDTFYSARKFFGVPDGAYLYTTHISPDIKIEQDYSYNRISHLAQRLERSANDAYSAFLKNDQMLYNQPIKRMSEFTRSVLSNTDYKNAKYIRERNFLYLHYELSEVNELKFPVNTLEGPMFYPLLLKNDNLRTLLIDQKIYVPQLWKNVYSTSQKNSYEFYLADYLFPLPIDQRYSIDDMNRVLNVILTAEK